MSSWSSPECSPPCHGGDRGFKSHRGRSWARSAFGDAASLSNWQDGFDSHTGYSLAKWWNRQTHGSQKAGLLTSVGVQLSPWSLMKAEYANRQSDQVESLVMVCGFDSHLGYC